MVGRTKTLKKIYRNSARVWSFAAAFMGDINQYYKEDKETQIEFAPKRGFDPQLIDCKSIEEQVDKAVDIVSRLSEHGYSPRNAMILYRWATQKGYPVIQELVAKLNQKGIRNQWITEDNEKKATFEWGEESVKISTVHSAKGMDAPVVIILGAETFRQNDDNFDDEEKLLYVALTRAREFLAVLYSGNSGMIPKLNDAMKDYKKFRKQIVELEKLANKNFVV
jgi:superfamily I DNA/RNA helicase